MISSGARILKKTVSRNMIFACGFLKKPLLEIVLALDN
jgi:hypothetical protein